MLGLLLHWGVVQGLWGGSQSSNPNWITASETVWPLNLLQASERLVLATWFHRVSRSYHHKSHYLDLSFTEDHFRSVKWNKSLGGGGKFLSHIKKKIKKKKQRWNPYIFHPTTSSKSHYRIGRKQEIKDYKRKGKPLKTQRVADPHCKAACMKQSLAHLLTGCKCRKKLWAAHWLQVLVMKFASATTHCL